VDASDAEVRAWARAQGREVSDKGKVGQALRSDYSAAHNGHEVAGDYPDGMTPDDFDLAAAVVDDGPDDDDFLETRPRPVSPKAPRAATILTGRLRRGGAKGSRSRKPSSRGSKRPRVSTSDLIGSAWRIAAKLAAPVPPMYRTLRLQSVIAGPLLDDAVNGTIADRVLQPLARMSRAGETTAALLAPNVAIGMAAWCQVQAAKTGSAPSPVIMQGCQEMLRYGLIAMMRVGGDAFAAQLAREKDDEQKYGADVDTIMAWIMSEPADPAAEEANIARMAARFAGQPEPEAA
jgi:hypothetical protein